MSPLTFTDTTGPWVCSKSFPNPPRTPSSLVLTIV